jgi:hypothetical protein
VKKINTLKERKIILINNLKVREKTTGDQDKIFNKIQNRIKIFEKKQEKNDLTIIIIADIIKLVNLPLKK